MFDGKPEEIDDWLGELQILFIGQPQDYAFDHARIATALSYLGGDKVRNFKNLTLAQAEQIDPTTGQPRGLGTWANFRDDIRTMFANPLRANDARNELWAIKWNPRRQTALEFRQQFLSLAHEAGMDNFPTLIQIYKHALPSGIRMEIALQHPSPGEDLAQWMTRVYERDLQWRSERGNEPQEKPKPRKPNRSARAAETQEEEDTVGINKLSAEQIKDLRTKGACFLCKKQGHIARNCPNRSNEQRNYRKPRWGNKGRERKARRVENAGEDEGDQETETDDESAVQQAAATMTDFKQKDF